jgi:hypothetical protein
MLNQKLKIIITYNTFKDFSIFENLYALKYFFKQKLNQIVFSLYLKKKYKKIIILKSPFVNKKTRNQLGFIFLKGKLILNFKYNLIDFFFINQFKNYLIYKLFQNKIFLKIVIVNIGFIF